MMNLKYKIQSIIFLLFSKNSNEKNEQLKHQFEGNFIYRTKILLAQLKGFI